MQSVEALLSWGQVTAINSWGFWALVEVLANDNLGTFLHTIFCPDPDTSPGPSDGRARVMTPSL